MEVRDVRSVIDGVFDQPGPENRYGFVIFLGSAVCYREMADAVDNPGFALLPTVGPQIYPGHPQVGLMREVRQCPLLECADKLLIVHGRVSFRQFTGNKNHPLAGGGCGNIKAHTGTNPSKCALYIFTIADFWAACQDASA